MAADFTGDGLDDLLVALGNWPTTEQYQVQLLVNDGAGHLVNGTSSVFECYVPANARMPAPHSHDGFEETIYGLDGVSMWTIDGETVEGRSR